MKVKDILSRKGPEVFTIGHTKSLAEAMKLLVTNKIGVLIVLNSNAKAIGILSERDILRAAYENPDNFTQIDVNQVMTGKVIVVEPEDDLAYAEQVMTDNRVRHLPVLHNNILVGLISIGDVVKAELKDISSENKYLLDYISGSVK